MAEALFYAVLLGVITGAIYDLCRLLRLALNDKFIVDFLFCVLFAVVFYCYVLIFNSGAIRILFLIFIFIGFLLYIFTLGSVTGKIEERVAKKIKIWLKKLKNRIKSFKKVLQLPRTIYYNICSRNKGKKRSKARVIKMTDQSRVNSIVQRINENKKKLATGLIVFILVGAFIFMSFTLIKNYSDINRLQIQKQEINAQYETQEQENEELKAILSSEDKDDYIEQKAREKGYAKSNEIVFYDISASE